MHICGGVGVGNMCVGRDSSHSGCVGCSESSGLMCVMWVVVWVWVVWVVVCVVVLWVGMYVDVCAVCTVTSILFAVAVSAGTGSVVEGTALGCWVVCWLVGLDVLGLLGWLLALYLVDCICVWVCL